MTKCPKCNVMVDDQHSHCPLCRKVISKSGQSNTSYPSYEELYKTVSNLTYKRILLFITISIIAISITTNALTFSVNPYFWSILTTVGLIYAWVLMHSVILSKKHFCRKMLTNHISLSTFLFVIDLCTDFSKWSTDYAIPLLGIVVTLVMTIYSISKKRFWEDNAGYLLTMFLVNLLPILLLLLKLSNVIWPSIAAVVYLLLTVTGIFIFARKKFKNELKKRFHS